MLNNQPVEKVLKTFDGTINVHSIFYTIQGEGPFCGRPAVFLRLAGCNLQCPWCDTEYTNGRVALSISDVCHQIENKHKGVVGEHLPVVVITGGEPFRQQIGQLIDTLYVMGYIVQVETNGTIAPPRLEHGRYRLHPGQHLDGVYIVCSPKTGKVHEALSARACCYKYVVDAENIDPSDGLPVTALGHTANPRLARPPKNWDLPIYVQPADHQEPEANARNMSAAVESCLTYGYTLQVQLHKVAGLE